MAEATPADWRDTCEHCGRAFDAGEPRWLEQRRYFVHTECARWELWEKPPYVWKLKETGSGTYTVHRADVTVGEIAGSDIVVREGLAKGDRIALAGVHILTESREVRLLTPEEEAKMTGGDPTPAADGTEENSGR